MSVSYGESSSLNASSSSTAEVLLDVCPRPTPMVLVTAAFSLCMYFFTVQLILDTFDPLNTRYLSPLYLIYFMTFTQMIF